MRHAWTRLVATARAVALFSILVCVLVVGYGRVRAAPVMQTSDITLSISASRNEVPINGDISFSIAVFTSGAARTITVDSDLPPELMVVAAAPLGAGTCTTSGQRITCTLSIDPTTPAQITVQARVRGDAPPGATLTTRVQSNGASAQVTIRIATYAVTPVPLTSTPTAWPTAPPTATLHPSAPPTATPPGFVATATPYATRPTTTATPTPYAGVWLTKNVSLSTVALGQAFTWNIAVNTGSPTPQRVRVYDFVGGSDVQILGATAAPGSCTVASNGNYVDCTVMVAQGSPAQISIQMRANTDPILAGRRIMNVARASVAGVPDSYSNPAYVQIGDNTTPIAAPTARPPWIGPTATPHVGGPTATPFWNPTPTDTGAPTSTPVGFVPTPTEDPQTSSAACAVAARAAVTKQGSLYSQGGALPDDPINPATGRPYPRTGPTSFDCSGLVSWAYGQAGVTVGGSTYTQIGDGTAINCTLADLHGTATTCWAPGDLIFLRYGGSTTGPGAGTGQHVAMYVGSGLFMDCYNYAVGCILHDISSDRFYQHHFWQARRVVSGCEGMTIDPGMPVTAPIGPPSDDRVCVPESPSYPDSGVSYMRGCGPPVLPDDGSGTVGTTLSQFDGIVAWLGKTGREPDNGTAAHLEYRIRLGGQTTDMCTWPNQLAGQPNSRPPPGGVSCQTIWADPMAFLAQANGDTMKTVDGTPMPVGWNDPSDPAFSEANLQLPPPGNAATLMFAPPDGDPGGAWWSPGNDKRAAGDRCPLGGPTITGWFQWLITFFFGWLFGC